MCLQFKLLSAGCWQHRLCLWFRNLRSPIRFLDVSVGSQEENKPRQGYTESTEPSPQSQTKEASTTSLDQKPPNWSDSSWYINSFLDRGSGADFERFDSVPSVFVLRIVSVIPLRLPCIGSWIFYLLILSEEPHPFDSSTFSVDR